MRVFEFINRARQYENEHKQKPSHVYMSEAVLQSLQKSIDSATCQDEYRFPVVFGGKFYGLFVMKHDGDDIRFAHET